MEQKAEGTKIVFEMHEIRGKEHKGAKGRQKEKSGKEDRKAREKGRQKKKESASEKKREGGEGRNKSKIHRKTEEKRYQFIA